MKANSFLSNMLILFAGTSLSQLLAIFAAPLLTRLYGPDAYGLMALFVSMTSIVSTISCMRYESSIILPDSDKAAANLLAGCLILSLVNCLLMMFLVYFGHHFLSKLLNAPSIEWYLWLVPFIALLDGAFNALNYWNTRTKRFLRLSIARINGSISSIAAQLYAGFSGYAIGGSLIGGIALGKAVSTGILGWQIWRDDQHLFRPSISRIKMVSELKRYIDFPLYDTWAELLNTVSWQLPVFLLSAFFSPAVVGYYSLGLSSLQLPMRLIGGSISQVFFQHASEAKISGSLSSLVERVFRSLLLIGTFPVLTLTLMGKDLFALVFGKTWSEAGIFSQILGFWILFWFVSSPLSTLYYLYERQQSFLKLTIANLFFRLIALCIGGYMGNARLSILLFSLSGICIYGYLCFAVMHIGGIEWQRTMHIILHSILVFIPSGVIILMLKVLAADQLIIVAVSALLCSIYYVYILKTNPDAKYVLNRMQIFDKLSNLRGNKN